MLTIMISDMHEKRIMRSLALLLVVLLPALLLSSCKNMEVRMQDGFYSAEIAEFDEHGWKEYITIYVSENTIVTVDYNAKNGSGFIKSWDMEYMQLMNRDDGTYPNKYAREYAEALINQQTPNRVDAISGATHSFVTFQALARAAIQQAYAGDTKLIYVDLTGVTGE